MQGEMFYDVPTVPDEVLKESPATVQFLLEIIYRRDIQHRIDIALRDDLLQRFVAHVASEMGVDPDQTDRLYDQADRERAANAESIVKKVREGREFLRLQDQYKKQFGKDIL